MPKIGETVRIHPTAYTACQGSEMDYPAEVTATVVGINQKHGWYRVKWNAGNAELYECIPLPVTPDPNPPSYRSSHKVLLEPEELEEIDRLLAEWTEKTT